MDNLRAQHLNFLMNKIPRRTLKDAENRILGQGNLISGKLK